jgi:hypothetical protein
MHGPDIESNARSLVLGLTGIGEQQGSQSDSRRRTITLLSAVILGVDLEYRELLHR